MKELDLMLNNNLNIDIKDYFKLKEEDKDYITKFILQSYSKNLDIEPKLVYMYLDMIEKVIQKSIEEESYEVAEIMKRSYDALNEKYKYFKHFPKYY